jgi:hypothetical protein
MVWPIPFGIRYEFLSYIRSTTHYCSLIICVSCLESTSHALIWFRMSLCLIFSWLTNTLLNSTSDLLNPVIQFSKRSTRKTARRSTFMYDGRATLAYLLDNPDDSHKIHVVTWSPVEKVVKTRDAVRKIFGDRSLGAVLVCLICLFGFVMDLAGGCFSVCFMF